MFDVVLTAAALIVFFALLLVLAGWSEEREYRKIAAWAQAHDWVCSRAGDGDRLLASLPKPIGEQVLARVEGTLRGNGFTLYTGVRSAAVFPAAVAPLPIRLHTAVVVHLSSAYPAVEVTSRAIPRRRTGPGAVGHAGFDSRFCVQTDAPGGPEAVIPRELADAHVAGTVPLWSVRDRELICVTDKRSKPANWEAAVDRAVRIAGLLGAPNTPVVDRYAEP